MKTIEAYECDFCGYTGLGKFEVEDHERNCIYNPSVKHCYTCGHFKAFDYDSTDLVIEEAKRIIPDFESYTSYMSKEYPEWFEIIYCRQMESDPVNCYEGKTFKCKQHCKLWVDKRLEKIED